MEKDDPVVVSVIIPTFNQAELLRKALQSVIRQSFTGWEAVVIDNCSTDTTREVTESFLDPRIKYFSFENKGVIAASRNKGIQEARGDYIAFLDSDDIWYSEKLSACLSQLVKGKDLACHGLSIRRNGVLSGKVTPLLPETRVFETLLYRGNAGIATSAVIVKKEIFDRYGLFLEQPEITTAEDYELWLRFSKSGASWAFIAENYGEYTIHGENASRNIERQMQAEENVVRKYSDRASPGPTREQILLMKRLIMIRLRAAERVLENNGLTESIRFLTGELS